MTDDSLIELSGVEIEHDSSAKMRGLGMTHAGEGALEADRAKKQIPHDH